MNVCTFFGHKDCPDSIEESLRNILIELIKKRQVDCFLVGNQGGFDRLVLKTLKCLSTAGFSFEYCVVLAYMPVCGNVGEQACEENTMVFPGIEKVPMRYAIDRRNTYMLSQAKYVITYVKGTVGGAYKFMNKAKRQNKIVINIAEKQKV